MRIVESMFDNKLHPYGEKYKIANDPIGYYKAIMKIVFSDRPRERTDATNAFMLYKIERNYTMPKSKSGGQRLSRHTTISTSNRKSRPTQC